MSSTDDGAATSVEVPERGTSEQTKKHLPLWQETLLLLTIAIVLAVVIKAFFVQAFYIPSESMEPGLVKNDRILVEKTSYWFGGTPQRGDVVVFKDPGGWLSAEEDAGPSNPIGQLMAKIGLYPSGGHLVKRVIGVAGDTIHCCDKQGRILVNGHPLDEDDYVKQSPGMACNGPMTTTCNWTAGPVPQGKVFVMGDNRDNSDDSSHAPVPAEGGPPTAPRSLRPGRRRRRQGVRAAVAQGPLPRAAPSGRLRRPPERLMSP